MSENLLIQNILPLIEHHRIDGLDMWVVLKCPVSGQRFATIVRLFVSDDDKYTIKEKTYNLIVGLRYSLFNALTGMFLKNLQLSNADSDILDKNALLVQPSRTITEEIINEGLIRAFVHLKKHFYWETSSKKYVSKKVFEDHLTNFIKQLNHYPVTEKNDLELLARMMIAVARVDGHFSTAERFFLSDFLEATFKSYEDLLKFKEPTEEELKQTSVGAVRETMLMIAWGVAITDRHLDRLEQKKLDDFALWFGIEPQRAAKIKRSAQLYVIEKIVEHNMVYDAWDVYAYDEVIDIAKNIGLEPKDVDLAVETLKKEL